MCIRIFLILAFVFCCTLVPAQNSSRETILTIHTEARQPNRGVLNLIDTFLVRKDFILEAIKVNYATAEINLETGVTRELTSGKRLESYNLTNYQEMIGMRFDIDKKPSAQTIETYRVSDGTKRGVRFFTEPYLVSGLTPANLIKDKDTTINGTKCLLLKNVQAIESAVKGYRDKLVTGKILINPALKSYSYPFISEKIVKQFGGGAIMYVDLITEAGLRRTVRYTYSPFKLNDSALFDHYQKIYNENLVLLDKVKKKIAC